MKELLRFVPYLLLLAMGSGMVLRAGRLEADGRLVEAKRVARSGGFLAALGSLAAAAGAGVLPATAGAARGAVAGLMLGAGFASLLAGLSGKPRPAGWAAFVLLFAGAVVAIASVR
jgi:hypothetical protein